MATSAIPKVTLKTGKFMESPRISLLNRKWRKKKGCDSPWEW